MTDEQSGRFLGIQIAVYRVTFRTREVLILNVKVNASIPEIKSSIRERKSIEEKLDTKKDILEFEP